MIRPDVSVLAAGHDVADGRLHRLVSVLSDHGLRVEVRGLGRPADGPENATVTTTPRGSLVSRGWRSLTLPWRARGSVVVVLDPDLVVPALGRRAAARVFGGAGKHVVVDVHEDYGLVLADRDWARGLQGQVGRVIVRAAARVSGRADLTVVADDHLPPAEGRRRLVVRNLPLRQLLPLPSERAAQPRAIYIGDVRRSRGLQRMLELAERCPAWNFDIVGPIAPADLAWVERWRTTSPAASRVAFHGRKPPQEAWRLAAGAWVGLCLLEETPAFRAALPTKLLEYLACGLAVITSELPRAARLVTDSGGGRVVSSVGEAAAVLDRWLVAPEELEVLRAAARRWSAGRLFDGQQYDALALAIKALCGVHGAPLAELDEPNDQRGSRSTL